MAIARLLAHSDINLAFCSLDALALVGVSAAIPDVERVTRRETTPELIDTAREVLAILRERQSMEDQKATLLRPSQPENDETLLRPASNAPDEERLLLRPSEEQHP